LKLWQIAIVTLAGVGYGLVQPGKLTYAFGQITLYVLLPGLIFEAAWHLNYRAMMRQWRAIAFLALPGVLLTALIIAGALAVVRVPFPVALLTGAILSATDPIAVVAAFKRLGAPRLLATIVESESLLNDAVAVVLYRAVLVAVLAVNLPAGAYARIAAASLAGSVFGAFVGAFAGFCVALLLRGSRGAFPQIVATLAGAYGTYLAVDTLHGSGIFATIAFGIALRYFERRWLALSIARDVDNFWNLAASAANVVVFFLVGAALDISIVAAAPVFVIATFAGVAVARFGLSSMLAPGGYPREWLDVIRVAGMRGALSLALAISLPPQTPYREAIVAATFAVAIATIVSSAFTVPPAVARVIGAAPRAM
jgi:CPA1 family monovalent cation:H+ antiporter